MPNRIYSSTKHQTALQKLRDTGYKAVDLHVHTSSSHDVPQEPQLSPQALYTNAKKVGMDYVVFTDHDTIQAHTDSFGTDHISAVELSVNDPKIGYIVHINIYCIDEKDFEYLQLHNTDIDSVLQYCRTHDLPHIYNHPFTFEAEDYAYVIRHPRQVIRSIKYLAEQIDVIEINHSRPKLLTKLVKPLAKKFNKALITSTDTHTGQIAQAYTLAQGNTFKEWFSNVKAGKSVMVHQISQEFFFDIEAYNYMNNVLKPQAKNVVLSTNVAVADSLIRFSSKYKSLSKLFIPILRPIVGLVTKSGLARKFYERNQRIISQLLEKNLV